mgnify:CR=1 FL=1
MSDEQVKAFIMRSSHEHTDKSDFRTPPYLFDWINDQWPIDYDGACVAGLNNLASPLRLEDEWPVGSTVYSNPPFDSPSIIKWFEKGQEHAKYGGIHIMLLPNKMCQVFFSSCVEQFDEIIFLGGRINFISPYATKGGTSMQGSIITRQGGGTAYHDTPMISSVLLRDIKKKWRDKQP